MEYTRAPDTSIIVAVVEAVSSFENSSPTSLPPLYDVVDTDALNALFETGSDATSDHGVSISFVFRISSSFFSLAYPSNYTELQQHIRDLVDNILASG